MLTIRGLEMRLRKLEAKLQPPEGVFFLAWGRDEQEADETGARAHAALTLQPNDLVVKFPWLWPHGMPASRWVQRKIGAFGRAEFGALALLIQVHWQSTVEEWAAADEPDADGKALAVELQQRWQDIDLPLARRCPRPVYLNDVSDADLIVAALGSGSSPC